MASTTNDAAYFKWAPSAQRKADHRENGEDGEKKFTGRAGRGGKHRVHSVAGEHILFLN
jgi:hypothetical protein